MHRGILCAQHSKHVIHETCGTSTYEGLLHQLQGYSTAGEDWESAYRSAMMRGTGIQERSDLVLPVIIHYLHPSNEVIDQGQMNRIQAVLDRINTRLAGAAICPDDAPTPNIGVQLCLAQRTIAGEPSDGIRYLAADLYAYDMCTDDAQLKAMGAHELYPTTDYLHLYLIPEVTASCHAGGDQIAAYASFPPAHGLTSDGIVLERHLRTMDDCQAHKVILHEIGHYLGLHHTFRGGCTNEDCLADGDKVCDTPPDDDSRPYPDHPCTIGDVRNSCSSDVQPDDANSPWTTDVADLSDNLMDYAPLSCLSQYTPGQVARMNQSLMTIRASLPRSSGCTPPCMTDLSWQIAWPSDTLATGRTATLRHATTGATYYRWTVNGEILSTSTVAEFTPAYDGTYTLCQEAITMDSSCVRRQCIDVTVRCAIDVAITWSPPSDLEAGDTLLAYPTTPGRMPLTWYVDGEAYADSDTISYQITDDNPHTLWAVRCDSHCCATSDPLHLQTAPCASGQEGRHWIFGRTGIHLEWVDGKPMEREKITIFSSDEPTATAIDEEGNLLFYFDGSLPYNSDNQVMDGWSGGLANSVSSTHAIALSWPGSDSLWYLFYPENSVSEPYFDSVTALHYVVIDMSLDDGRGAVITEERTLLTYSTEKVAAIRQCNGLDWWLIGHEAGSNAYYTWPITSTGIGSPIISNQGRFIPRLGLHKAGQLSFGPHGDQLLSCTASYGGLNASGDLELYHFNRSDGHIRRSFTFSKAGDLQYGANFSPSGRYAYQPTIIAGPPRYGIILQYDLWAGDSTAIMASEREVFRTTETSHFGLFFVAPARDGKLYLADTGDSSLCVIHAPDRPGYACRVDVRGQPLTTGRCFVGLPTFPADVHEPYKAYIRGPVRLCDTISSAMYRVDVGCGYRDLIWSASAGLRLSSTTEDTIIIDQPPAGRHRLYLTHTTACRQVTDTLHIDVVDCSDLMPCHIDVDIVDIDLHPCDGSPPRWELYTDADYMHYRLDSDMHPVVFTPGQAQLRDPITRADTLRIFFTKQDCDTVLVWPIEPADTLFYQIMQLDTSICRGDTAILAIEVDSSVVQVLPADLSTATTLYDPSSYHWADLMQDTLVYVRIHDTLYDCDVLLPWSISIDTPYVIQDTLYYCDGDSLWVFDDLVVTSDADTGRYVRQAPSCSDTTIIRHVRRSADITLDVIVDTACNTGQGSIRWTLPDEAYILWDDGDTSRMRSLPSGRYEVTIGVGDCATDTSVILPTYSAPDYTIDARDQRCPGTPDGQLIIIGDDVARWRIDSGAWSIDRIFDEVSPGSYGIELEDIHGCRYTDSVYVRESLLEIPHLVLIDPLCPGDSGTVDLTDLRIASTSVDGMMVTGPTLHLIAGTYDLQLVDSTGCTWDTTIYITDGAPQDYTLISADPSCMGDDNGYILLQAPLSYGWRIDGQSLQSGDTLQDLPAGAYVIAIVDTSRDCMTQDTVRLADGLLLDLDILTDTVRFTGTELGRFDPAPFISGSPTTYYWIPDDVLDCPDCSVLSVPQGADGSYTLTITNGPCSRADSIIIQFDHHGIYLPTAFHPDGQHNTTFGAYSYSMQEAVHSMRIYGRWGQLVYDCRGDLSTCRWDGMIDGQLAPVDTYTYVLQITDSTGQSRLYQGQMVLMR